MLIVEFAGLPGCGKTTACDLMEQKLAEKKYHTINLQKILPGNTVAQKVSRRVLNEKAKHSGINRELSKTLSKYAQNDQASEWIERMLVMNYRIHTESSKYDIVLLDEGFVQFVTSLFHGSQIQDESMISGIFQNLCREYHEHVLLCSCHTDMKLVLERLKKRNREGDRFLADSDEKSFALLAQKQENLNFAMKEFGHPIVDIIMTAKPAAIADNLIIAISPELNQK